MRGGSTEPSVRKGRLPLVLTFSCSLSGEGRLVFGLWTSWCHHPFLLCWTFSNQRPDHLVRRRFAKSFVHPECELCGCYYLVRGYYCGFFSVEELGQLVELGGVPLLLPLEGRPSGHLPVRLQLFEVVDDHRCPLTEDLQALPVHALAAQRGVDQRGDRPVRILERHGEVVPGHG